MAILDDPIPGRGWFVAYVAEDRPTAFDLRPMFELFRANSAIWPWHELRAWVEDGNVRDERFARWFGFELDCGPASGWSPSGRDMNLFLWRRK